MLLFSLIKSDSTATETSVRKQRFMQEMYCVNNGLGPNDSQHVHGHIPAEGIASVTNPLPHSPPPPPPTAVPTVDTVAHDVATQDP